jgi:hypothetical protein
MAIVAVRKPMESLFGGWRYGLLNYRIALTLVRIVMPGRFQDGEFRDSISFK